MTSSRNTIRSDAKITALTVGNIATLILSATVIVTVVMVTIFRSSGADTVPSGSLIGNGAVAAAALSPAAALVADKPILLFCYPYEACQIRYCLQPNQVAAQLDEAFGDAVSFVPVVTHTIATDPAGLEATVPRENATLPMENWNLWLLPPYDAWVPEMQETSAGLGLRQPTLVLVDRDQQVRQLGYNTHEVFAAIHELTE